MMHMHDVQVPYSSIVHRFFSLTFGFDTDSLDPLWTPMEQGISFSLVACMN